MSVFAFGKPFDEQVAAFRIRLANLIPTTAWDDVWQSGHDTGFMVAGAMKAELLADIGAAVEKAITQGTTLAEFRRDFRQIVEARGWHGWTGEGTKKGEAWRTRVIYKTNMSTSYAAGRFAQLKAAGFKFWIYHHGNARDPRIEHLGWDGLVLGEDHPFWVSHYPPNGWGCTCYVTGARSEAAARRRAGKVVELPDSWDAISAKTGAPVGIDKGWAYAPGRSVADQINAAMVKLPKLPAPLGAALVTNLRPSAFDELDRQFAAFVDDALARHVEHKFMIIGALRPDWIAGAKANGVEVASSEIAVSDLNIQHAFRGTPHVTAKSTRAPNPAQKAKVNPVDLAWYRSLPGRLRSPTAVLLDKRKEPPHFLLIFDERGLKNKLVIEINTPPKKASGVMNAMQSARVVMIDDLIADLKGGGGRVVQIYGKPILQEKSDRKKR